MIPQHQNPIVVEGRIVTGRSGWCFRTHPDRRLLDLALDEDPSGFVGIPIRAEGVLIPDNRFAILSMRRMPATRDRV